MFLVEKLTGEQFITLNYSCHQSLSKTHIIDSASQLTNEKTYHMILVIIINERDEIMLQRTLGSGWGVLLPGLLIAGLMYADLSSDQWRIVILMGLVLTPMMLYHKQLRHYILLPSCLALIAGIMLMIMNLNQG